MNCLWCDQEMIVQINWENLIPLVKLEKLCNKCQQSLEILSGEMCRKCSRKSEQQLCIDCNQWLKDEKEDSLISNVSVFAYNEHIQAMITKWKYRGDYVLGEAFESLFFHKFKKEFSQVDKEIVIVPIPLSKERLYERGFNQAKVLADFLPVKNIDVMTRIHSEKQSKKTREERISTKNPFKMHKKVNKPVILVDDIYTTGTTLRHAANLLRANGCPKVYAYTLIRG